MLQELMEYLFENNQGRKEADYRILHLPGAIRGRVYAVNKDGFVVNDSYTMEPPVLVTHTIAGMVAILEAGLPAVIEKPESSWYVAVGKTNIRAFRTHKDYASLYECPSVILGLHNTPSYNFATKASKWKPGELIKTIKTLFTGMSSVPVIADQATNIIDLIPFLSKVNVKVVEQSKSTNSKTNETLGVDINRELLDADSMPEVVRVPVYVYDEFSFMTYVDMALAFDFDEKMFLLTPIQPSVVAAEEDTSDKLLDALKPDEGDIVQAHIELQGNAQPKFV